jgi:predicted transcriptional regulator
MPLARDKTAVFNSIGVGLQIGCRIIALCASIGRNFQIPFIVKSLILNKDSNMHKDLTIQTKKIDLIQWLSTIEDENILDKIADLIAKESKNDWWLTTSDAEKSSIEKGLNDAENGKLNPHTKAREIYGKWL